MRVWDWTDGEYMASRLERLAHRITDLAHGDARGADRLAAAWASKHPSIKVHAYPANWRQIGRGAGHARNHEMLRDFDPDLVVAFKDSFDYTLSRGGTEHMVRIAEAAAVPTIVFDRTSSERDGQGST